MPAVARIAAASAPSALSEFARDIDSLFVPPPPLPSPETRAQALAASIDWSQQTIVVWVPGTSDHEVPTHVADRIRKAGGPAAYAMLYQATWRLRDSVPDGEATLRAFMELVAKRRRPGQRIVLIGESQGAWVISSIMRDPALAKHVFRASLVAHPSMAPAHVHESTSTDERLTAAKVREFNGETDVVTREVGESAETAIDVVDSFARLDVGRALGRAAKILVTNPGLIQALVASQLFRLRGQSNPHSSSDLMTDAVTWVLGKQAAAVASRSSS